MDTAAGGPAAGSAAGEQPAAEGRKSRLKVVVLCLVLALGVALVYLTPLKAWFSRDNAERIRQALQGMGLWTYPVSILTIAGLIAAGMPRLLFCALGGALLGFWPALLVNEVGTLLAYYGVFLFVRWGGRDYVLHKWPKLERWAEALQQQGTVGVIMARLVPIHGTLINLCFGLSHVRHRSFLIGTALGILAEAAPVILIGAGLAKASLKDSMGQIGIAVLAFAGVWFVCRYLAKRKKRN